jgi:hypothetical protein
MAEKMAGFRIITSEPSYVRVLANCMYDLQGANA